MTDCSRPGHTGSRSVAGRADQFSGGTPRVLVVEDSETIREMVSEALADVGYHRLVADMLDLSRIDAGLALDLRDTDLGGIVAEEADRAAMLAPRVRIARTGLPTLTIKADPTRVAQILSNLLDNARKHTSDGGSITVDLEWADDMAEVTVIDTGPGVPDGERDRIFERLVRLDEGRARDHGGAGLGLPIARALARAHGGELVCLPHEGGARFQLSLPASVD